MSYFYDSKDMKKSSEDSYLRLVAQLIKDESRKGKCYVKIPKDDHHNSILVKELESAGYDVRLSTDNTILFIRWS